VFRLSGKPSDFSTNELQKLVDRSLFSGTNIASLLGGRSNIASLDAPIRLATDRSLDRFFVDPRAGTISYSTRKTGVNLRLDTPSYDDVPSFDDLLRQVLNLAAGFGVSTNEMEHKDDGSLFLRKSEDKTVSRGGALKFINRRSLAVSRSLAGYPIFASTDRVEMALGVKGYLIQCDLKWPSMVATRTNQILSIKQITDNIKNGRCVADAQNQYPGDGVSEILLKDMRVFYYIPESKSNRLVSTNIDVFPIASFHAVFRSKNGKSEEGGLFTPLIDP
jgi:hypothetical protein